MGGKIWRDRMLVPDTVTPLLKLEAIMRFHGTYDLSICNVGIVTGLVRVNRVCMRNESGKSTEMLFYRRLGRDATK